MTYRILVTGSRTSKDWEIVWQATEEAIDRGRALGHTDFEVVHGGAEGPDTFAHDFCEDQAGWYSDYASLSLGEELHRPDWSTCKGPKCTPAHRKPRRDGSTFCPRAPLTRDDEMVALGANECLAFIDPCAKPGCRKVQPHGSHGASYTADRAEDAGIPTLRYPAIPGQPHRHRPALPPTP